MVIVLALPVNLIAGLFGTNVGGIPLAEHRHGFWVIVWVVLCFTALLSFLALRGRWH